MSPLPQRKKSAEEIAKLREELGIGGEAPPPPDFKHETPPAPPAKADRAKQVPDPMPDLRSPEIADSEPHPPPAGPDERTAARPQPKPVRSLKKAERLPVEQRPKSSESKASKIPFKRRSEEDINELRRREALSRMSQPQTPLFAPLLAHPAILGAGYLLAITGGLFAWRDLHFAWMATSETIALAVAAFIFFKKTLSRHHAGFIAILAIFISIFAALHYFPPLQNAP